LIEVIVIAIFLEETIAEDFRDEEKTFVNVDDLSNVDESITKEIEIFSSHTLESSDFKSEIFPFFGTPTRIRMGVMDASRQNIKILIIRFFGTGTGTERDI
jgi:hypothetical protein